MNIFIVLLIVCFGCNTVVNGDDNPYICKRCIILDAEFESDGWHANDPNDILLIEKLPFYKFSSIPCLPHNNVTGTLNSYLCTWKPESEAYVYERTKTGEESTCTKCKPIFQKVAKPAFNYDWFDMDRAGLPSGGQLVIVCVGVFTTFALRFIFLDWGHCFASRLNF